MNHRDRPRIIRRRRQKEEIRALLEQMVADGLLTVDEEGRYYITEKGREERKKRGL